MNINKLPKPARNALLVALALFVALGMVFRVNYLTHATLPTTVKVALVAFTLALSIVLIVVGIVMQKIKARWIIAIEATVAIVYAIAVDVPGYNMGAAQVMSAHFSAQQPLLASTIQYEFADGILSISRRTAALNDMYAVNFNGTQTMRDAACGITARTPRNAVSGSLVGIFDRGDARCADAQGDGVRAATDAIDAELNRPLTPTSLSAHLVDAARVLPHIGHITTVHRVAIMLLNSHLPNAYGVVAQQLDPRQRKLLESTVMFRAAIQQGR